MSGKHKNNGQMTQIGHDEQALECPECNAVWVAILQLAAAIEPHEQQDTANDTRYAEAFAQLSGLVENRAVAGGVAQAVRTLWACWAVKD